MPLDAPVVAKTVAGSDRERTAAPARASGLVWHDIEIHDEVCERMAVINLSQD